VPVPFSVWTKAPICGTFQQFATRRPHGDPFADERFYRAFVITICVLRAKRAISSYFVFICLALAYKGGSTRKTPSAKSYRNERRNLRLGRRGLSSRGYGVHSHVKHSCRMASSAANAVCLPSRQSALERAASPQTGCLKLILRFRFRPETY
jgi:hypothetical protein